MNVTSIFILQQMVSASSNRLVRDWQMRYLPKSLFFSKNNWRERVERVNGCENHKLTSLQSKFAISFKICKYVKGLFVQTADGLNIRHHRWLSILSSSWGSRKKKHIRWELFDWLTAPNKYQQSPNYLKLDKKGWISISPSEVPISTLSPTT